MKIAIDIRTAGGEKAGKGWYTFHIVQNLIKLDHQNQYILYAKNGIPGFEQFKNSKQKIIKGSGFFWHKKVARDVKKENIDIFFAPGSYIIPAILPGSVKKIIAVHDLVTFYFPDTHNKKAVLIERLYLKKALKKADRILASSKNTKKDILEKFKINPEKIKVIYCAAGENFKPLKKDSLKPVIEKTNLPKNFFLAVGTLIPRKNYPNLLKAFVQIHEKFPDYHLIIVGNKGWDYDEIYKIIQKNYLNKYVHLLGYLSEKSLINLYNLAKALVFPSFYEGFGIPPLEAMKCGCLVIASFTSSIPEVVDEAGILINPENPTEIAGAMAQLITDEDLCEKFRNLGFIQSKKFSWDLSSERLLEIINSINLPGRTD
ncbi:glycosyltransferase [Candidatus Peregrinibacteria bacterium]|nr:glycosyltransferase [Candidatus Peregrinibacteria bacterium]